MAVQQAYRTIVAVDIERFSHPGRDDRIRVQLRNDLERLLLGALAGAGASPDRLLSSSTGDGLLVAVAPDVPTARIIVALLDRFGAALAKRNRAVPEPARMRVRGVVHAAHVMLDRQGVTGEQVTLAFRLLDADALRSLLLATPEPLLVGLSDDVYHQVVRHRPDGLDPAAFTPVTLAAKEIVARAWVHAGAGPGRDAPGGGLRAGRRVGAMGPAEQRHWDPRARGVQRRGQPGWHFTGRVAALRALVGWIDDRDGDTAGCVVVTGDPGSGKSAVLARLVTLADPAYRASVPAETVAAASEGTLPAVGSVQVALHAARKPPAQVAAELAAAAACPAGDAQSVVEALLDRDQELLVVLDALDETTAPEALIRDLLNPLILEEGSRVRLLIGTRRHLLPLLPGARVVDLDAEYLDLADVTAYAAGLLAARHPAYRSRPALTRRVAGAIAGRAGRSFLVAQLTARALAADPAVVDTGHVGWQRLLPASVGAAMDRYLACLPTDEQRVRDLLRPLAWAEGDGLADDELWAELATALGTASYQGYDVRWLRATLAGNLLQTSRTGSGVASRLFHQALAEHLRASTTVPEAQRAFVRLLSARVPDLPPAEAGAGPATGRRKDWRAADPYTRLHLSTHAAACGKLATLVADPLYLAAASPSRLRHAIESAGRLGRDTTATVYLRTAHLLSETDPGHNAAHLELAARLMGEHAVAHEMAGLTVQRPWRPVWAHGEGAARTGILPGNGSIRAVAVARLPSGTRVVLSGGDDGTIRRWDLHGRTALGQPLRGHRGMIAALATATLPDGRMAAVSSSSDGTIRAWDVATGAAVGNPVRDVDGYSRALALGTLPDGRVVLAGGCADHSVRVLDLLTGDHVATLRGHTDRVQALHIVTAADGRVLLLSGGLDRELRAWELPGGRPVGAPARGHAEGVQSVAAATLPDGRLVAISGGLDGTVRRWDAATGASIGVPLSGHQGWAWSVATAELPDGSSVGIAGSTDGTITVWDLDSGALRVGPIHGHAATVEVVTTAALAGDPPVLVSAGKDGLVRMWDIATGRSIGAPLSGHVGWIRTVASGPVPDGSPFVASGGHDGVVRVWDLGTGTLLRRGAESHAGFVQSMTTATLPDGRVAVISGGRDGLVRIWDLETGARVGEPLRRHPGGVRAVVTCTLPDGRKVLVSGGRDGLARVWDLADGVQIGEAIQGHRDGVRAMATCTLPDGRMVLVSGGRDGHVRAWHLTTGAPLMQRIGEHVGWVRAVATGTLPDGRAVLLAGDSTGAVRLWDLATARAVGAPLSGHRSYVRSLESGRLPDGRLVIASGSADGGLQVWVLPDREQVCRIELGGVIYSMAFVSPNVIVAAAAHGLIRLDLPL
jgi:WD40 repeat protein